jgi:hypothetical protein
MAASAKQAADRTFAKRFIEILPSVFWFAGINPSREVLFLLIDDGMKNGKAKGAAE